ncbi:hypothetical protein BRDID11002_60620 [Bradyrhizobium diazoefficiens]
MKRTRLSMRTRNSGTVIAAESSVIAHHTSHHEPGPKCWSVNGAISPEARMPMPGAGIETG